MVLPSLLYFCKDPLLQLPDLSDALKVSGPKCIMVAVQLLVREPGAFGDIGFWLFTKGMSYGQALLRRQGRVYQ